MNKNTPQFPHVCSVIVTYNPDVDRLISLIKSIYYSVDKIVVVDNGCDVETSSEKLDKIIQLCDYQDSIIYLPMEKNIGLASGLNKGLSWILAKDYTYVLPLDQDSVPQENMLECLFEAASEIEKNNIKLAAVGSRHLDPRTNFISSYDKQGHYWFENTRIQLSKSIKVNYLQSSGSLIPTQTLREVGLMDEGLFIHHIDQEWSIRAKSKGFYSFGSSKAIMEHVVGTNTLKIWIGYRRDVHLHSPKRHYFAFRNSILLYSRMYMTVAWKIDDLSRLIFMFVIYLIIVSPRYEYLKMVYLGVKDGLRGATGDLQQIEE
jgi:rhamnosyltransferase